MSKIGAITAVLTLLASGSAWAQAGGGGSGATTTNPNAAACIQPGPDGRPSRKLSSEEVCPMYSFWRDECARAGKAGQMGALGHCTPRAMDRDDIVTGSIRPATR